MCDIYKDEKLNIEYEKRNKWKNFIFSLTEYQDQLLFNNENTLDEQFNLKYFGFLRSRMYDDVQNDKNFDEVYKNYLNNCENYK
jgi:hypothetical protein